METIGVLFLFFVGSALGATGGWQAARLTRHEREQALLRQIHALRAAQDIALTAWASRKAMSDEAKRLRQKEDQA